MLNFKQFLLEKHGVSHDFSSTQINLPLNLASKIIKWGKKNIKPEDLFDPQNHGRENEIHVTVLYGINEESSDQIKSLLENQKPFKLKLGQVSLFKNNDKFDVIKLEVNSPDLIKLNKLLRDNLKVTETHPYSPHVTIAYVKKNSCDVLNKNTLFKNKAWDADKIIFSSKNGTKTQIKL
jgi:2'-5' RNA ligase